MVLLRLIIVGSWELTVRLTGLFRRLLNCTSPIAEPQVFGKMGHLAHFRTSLCLA